MPEDRNSFGSPDYLDLEEVLFPARLTGFVVDIGGTSGGGSGSVYYGFVEQIVDVDGQYIDAPSPRFGNWETGPFLVEMNNVQTNQGYAWIRLRGFFQGQPLYEFQADGSGTPENVPVPSITDPEGYTAYGPPFNFTSFYGTVQISVTGPNTVNFEVDDGPLMQICLIDCDGIGRCFQLPLKYYLGEGGTDGCDTIIPTITGGTGVPTELAYYCMLPPPDIGGTNPPVVCGVCIDPLPEYCVAYPAWEGDFADEYACDIFATAGYQTVSLVSGNPCSWVFEEDSSTFPCYITMGFSGTPPDVSLYVLFGNSPGQAQLGSYYANLNTASGGISWDCLTTSIPLTLSDPDSYPGAPPSITVYPGACPPVISPPPPASCMPCSSPPVQVCITIPDLEIQIGTCGLCAALGAGITLAYSTNLFPLSGVAYCGWTATYAAGQGCTGDGVPDHDTVITLYYDFDGGSSNGQWILLIGSLYQVRYATGMGATWDCTTALTLYLDASSISSANDCAGFPSTITVEPAPCTTSPGPGAGDLYYCLNEPPGGSQWYCLQPPGTSGNFCYFLDSDTLELYLGEGYTLIGSYGDGSGAEADCNECGPTAPIIWTAPADGDYVIECYGGGASGGAPGYTDAVAFRQYSGSGGEYYRATLALNAGDTLSIVQGQGGIYTTWDTSPNNGCGTSSVATVITGIYTGNYVAAQGGYTIFGAPPGPASGTIGGTSAQGYISSPNDTDATSFPSGGCGGGGGAGSGGDGAQGGVEGYPTGGAGGAGGIQQAGFGPAGGNGGDGGDGTSSSDGLDGQTIGGAGGGAGSADGTAVGQPGNGVDGAVFINGVRII